jgi:hypothetical protein
MFITLKKHKEIIKNLEASLKADLVAKDELIKRLLGEIIEKEQEIKELQTVEQTFIIRKIGG